ncbi:hypothetical protein ASD99_27050 [Mesorhizobium sp. Root695]|nr:hypothetical protein ASD99_27050 [Mesorhizobium sp. Root695]
MSFLRQDAYLSDGHQLIEGRGRAYVVVVRLRVHPKRGAAAIALTPGLVMAGTFRIAACGVSAMMIEYCSQERSLVVERP